VIEAGAVGMNFEDARDDPANPLTELPLQLKRIAAIREAGRATGVPLVLNARTDVYLKNVGAAESRYDEVLRRLAAFRDAGADCVFAPGLHDAGTIARLVRDLGCPLNILAGPGAPPIPELQKLGVARVSLGSSVMRATLGTLQKIAAELADDGTYKLLEGAPSYEEVTRLMQ
jgi:2-methylisocitrate lyase-like PEP mutase family enzyme